MNFNENFVEGLLRVSDSFQWVPVKRLLGVSGEREGGVSGQLTLVSEGPTMVSEKLLGISGKFKEGLNAFQRISWGFSVFQGASEEFHEVLRESYGIIEGVPVDC